MVIRNAILKKHFEKLGFDDAFFESYETFASDGMQNMDAMVASLRIAYLTKQKIVIYTDFDVDGIMSSVVAYAGMSELGFSVDLFKPTPADGYGFRITDVDAIMEQFPDVAVIFTGDVGIGCNKAIDYAHSKGLKVLVTDHHISKNPCTADYALNPNQLGETYSHNGICGSVVVYRLLQAYADMYCDATTRADIYRLQLFAGIATISDIMPLLYENRPLVRNSIALMQYFYNYELKNGTLAPPVYSDNYSRAFVGIKMLLEYFTAEGKIKSPKDIDEQFYGFYLVPLLNSGKRMDGDMNIIYDIFFHPVVKSLSESNTTRCVENAIKYVATLNEKRKELTAMYFEELYETKLSDGNPDFTRFCMDSEVYVTSAPAGLLGLLATKFLNITGMPTLVITQLDDGTFIGSGRNPVWFDFFGTAVPALSGFTAEGHAEAFGVSFLDINDVFAYCEFFKTVVLPAYASAAERNALAPDTSITVTNIAGYSCDFVCDTIMLLDYLAEKAMFHPFGKAFPEPSFVFYVDINSVTTTMFGRQKQHIKLVTENGVELMLFNQALDYEVFAYANRDTHKPLACRGSFRLDSFNSEYDTISFFVDSIEEA